jgi:ankyrin repeat protein
MLVAARRGDVAAVSSLLSQGVDVNLCASCSKISGMDGASALIWAARQGVAIQNLIK